MCSNINKYTLLYKKICSVIYINASGKIGPILHQKTCFYLEMHYIYFTDGL